MFFSQIEFDVMQWHLKHRTACSYVTGLAITNIIIVYNFVDNFNSIYIVAMATSYPAVNMAHMRRPY